MEGPYLVQLQVSTWFTGLSLPTRLAPGFQPSILPPIDFLNAWVEGGFFKSPSVGL